MTTPSELPSAEVQVLLPSCNRRDYLREALDSVLSQTYRDFHILVIDDASSDGTAELAQEYERRFPGRVTALRKCQRRGLADSINLGLRLTHKAPFVAFHNDDDVWAPTKLGAQIDAFRANPGLGLVATEAEVIGPEGRPTGMLFSDLFGKPDLSNAARRIFWEGNCLCAASVVAKRAALDLLQPYPFAGGCQDMSMWLQISAHMPVAWLNEPLTSWRKAPGQMTEARAGQMWRETYALRDRLFRDDATVRNAVGGESARRRLDGDALYRSYLYLRQWNLPDYTWFAGQVIKRHSLRLTILLGFHTARALIAGSTTDFAEPSQASSASVSTRRR